MGSCCRRDGGSQIRFSFEKPSENISVFPRRVTQKNPLHSCNRRSPPRPGSLLVGRFEPVRFSVSGRSRHGHEEPTDAGDFPSVSGEPTEDIWSSCRNSRRVGRYRTRTRSSYRAEWRPYPAAAVESAAALRSRCGGGITGAGHGSGCGACASRRYLEGGGWGWCWGRWGVGATATSGSERWQVGRVFGGAAGTGSVAKGSWWAIFFPSVSVSQKKCLF